MRPHEVTTEAESRLETVLADADTVIVAGVDTHGMMRGKRIPAAEFRRLLAHGMPLSDVFWVMHIDESDLVDAPAGHRGYFPTKARGYPDILAVPDVATLRPVPWHERTALVLCDWHLPGGEPVPLDPRGLLRRVVERARSMGFEPRCAHELEFYVLRETPATIPARRACELRPLSERPSTYGVVKGSEQETVGALIRASLTAYGLPLEACSPETGPGQFELTLRYGPALAATDQAFLFKSGVKEVVARQGLTATFMAKPRADWAGSSCHVHLSLTDLEGESAFYDPAAPHGISGVMRQFIGGSLAVMDEVSAVLGPTVNSYRRYTDYSWAATTATWGIGNRSTGLRAIVEGPEGTRIEHRRAGADANVYLAAAVILAGGLYGVEKGIDAPDMFSGDVYAQPPSAVPRLPASLGEAADLLDRSAMVRDWLGDDFVDHFVAMKRAELEAESLAVTDWQIARYLEAL